MITALPEAPSRSDTAADFIAKADAWLAAQAQFVIEVNAQTASAYNVTKWISGTTYALGDPVWSPANGQTYRRLIAGAGTTDPSADATNWVLAVSATVPTGAVLDFAGTAAPAGYLACDGSNVSRTTYAQLFTAIGTTHGVGDGSTTFTLPDFRRRTAVGSGGTGTGTLGASVGNTGGAETHTLSQAELPAHTHTGTTGTESATHTHTQQGNGVYGSYAGAGAPGPDASATSQTGAASVTHTHSFTTSSIGSGTAHNNLQPSLVTLKIIKT
jgi:microcystin-dependent protein